MRRPAHGATCKPGPCHPAGGYGQPIGRPGPRVPVAGRGPLELEILVEPTRSPDIGPPPIPLDPAVS